MNEDVQKFINDKQKFLKLNPGEEFTGYYMSCKIIPDKFKIAEDPEAKTIAWKFRTEHGKEIEWTNGNLSATKAIIALKVGQAFKMKRIGMGNKTTYEVTPLDQVLDEKIPF